MDEEEFAQYLVKGEKNCLSGETALIREVMIKGAISYGISSFLVFLERNMND